MGLIARALEESGMATTCVSAARDITAAARPPRAVFVDFPLGHTTGRPDDPDLSLAIVRSALDLVPRAAEQLVDLPFHWSDDDDWKNTAYRPAPDPLTGEVRHLDDRTERVATPSFQTDQDATAAAEAHEGRQCEVCAGIDY